MKDIASIPKAGFRALKICVALGLICGLIFAGGCPILGLPSGVSKAIAADTRFKTMESIAATGSWTDFTTTNLSTDDETDACVSFDPKQHIID